jgi:cell division transport system permease protein
MLSRALHILRETLKGLSGSKLMTLTVIVDITISLFLAGMVALILINIQNFIQSAKSKIDFEVYLEDEGLEENKPIIEQRLRELPGIAEMSFISKEQAFELAQQDSVLQSALTEIQENPLPASFKIMLAPDHQNQAKMDELMREISSIQGVEEISPISAWVAKLEMYHNRFMLYGTIILAIICINLFMVASSSIRLTISARHSLIEILRLFGATRRTISMPFILENLLKGIIGGTASGLILFFLFLLSKKMFPAVLFYPSICIGQIFFGALLGILGSTYTLNKLIK